MTAPEAGQSPKATKLTDQLGEVLPVKHFALRTEHVFVMWRGSS